MSLNVQHAPVRMVSLLSNVSPVNFVTGFQTFKRAFGLEVNRENLFITTLVECFNNSEERTVVRPIDSNAEIYHLLGRAVDLISERSSNDVRQGKKYVILVTDGFMSPLVAHSDLHVEHDQPCVQCLPFEQIINRLRQNEIELIISGDNEAVTQTDWDLNARIAQLTGGLFVPFKHLEKFLSKFVDNVNSGAFNLRQILTQVENEGVHDNSQSDASIVQRSAPIPIKKPSSVDQKDETMIVGRPDVEKIIYAIY